MTVLIHEVFHVLEAHYIVHHDSPVIGACEYVKTRETKHGPYETKRSAHRRIRSLIRRYTSAGYRQFKDSSWTLGDSGHGEITFTVEEEVLSKRPVK